MSESGFGFPPDFGLGEQILRLWALQLLFLAVENNYMPKFYFWLSATLHSFFCFLQRFTTSIALKSDSLVPSLEFARPMPLDLRSGGGLAVTGIALGGRTSGASRRWFCPKSYASVCVGNV